MHTEHLAANAATRGVSLDIFLETALKEIAYEDLDAFLEEEQKAAEEENKKEIPPFNLDELLDITPNEVPDKNLDELL